MPSTAILERAFELARSGHYETLEQIRRRLVRERFEDVDQHLSGSLIRNQLRKALLDSRSADPLVAG
jgi:hypothetical protein